MYMWCTCHDVVLPFHTHTVFCDTRSRILKKRTKWAREHVQYNHKVREYYVYRDGHGLGSMATHDVMMM